MLTRRWTPVALVVVVIVALDQLTKQWALRALDEGRVIEVLPTLELDLTRNSGFSFGAGAGNGRLVAILVTVVCGLLIWAIGRETMTSRRLILATILGGALGNLLDRVFRAEEGFLTGEVVDFIDVTWYAVFNVADIFVVGGCVALILHELHLRRSDDGEVAHT